MGGFRQLLYIIIVEGIAPVAAIAIVLLLLVFSSINFVKETARLAVKSVIIENIDIQTAKNGFLHSIPPFLSNPKWEKFEEVLMSNFDYFVLKSYDGQARIEIAKMAKDSKVDVNRTKAFFRSVTVEQKRDLVIKMVDKVEDTYKLTKDAEVSSVSNYATKYIVKKAEQFISELQLEATEPSVRRAPVQTKLDKLKFWHTA